MMKPNKNKRLLSYYCIFVTLLLLGNKSIAQPIANFSTSTDVSGCAPLTVSFKDMSTGNPTSWKWDLGNSSISTQQNPTATYFTPGVYVVSLTVSNNKGSNTLTKTNYITVYEKPNVNFVASDSITCFPKNISFTDLSTAGSGTIVSREWDFGDGSISTVQNPTHTYTASGNYSVTLKITNNNGCTKTFTKLRYIQASQRVTAAFSESTPVKCNPPEVINFTNNTSGPGTLTYTWDFGDGNSSTTTSPKNNYGNSGYYSVKLIAKSSLGCSDTLIKRNLIVIKDVKPKIMGPDSICVGSTAAFSNISNPPPASSYWTFGDVTVKGFNGFKAWSTPGTYTVSMTNDYATCSTVTSKVIVVNANPVANFKADDSISCSTPMTVNFQDLTIGATEWQWNFGDLGSGGSSTLKNPTYIYNDFGQATVTLTVKNAAGCSNSFTKNQYIKIAKPTAKIVATVSEGCIPFTFKPTANITTIDGIQSYLWDFGDGNTSSSSTPTNIYPVQGTYPVTLTVTTKDGCIVTDKLIDSVHTGTLPTADFTATPLAECAGSDIQFTDQSIPADKWFWSFGDGNISSTQNPLKAYNDTGYFNVKLTAWNNGCSTSVTKSKFVNIFPSVSKFTPIYDCVNKLHVTFKDKSILPQSWFWDFGDGQTSTLQNPEHIYAALGRYTVTLTTSNGTCSNTLEQSILLVDETPTVFVKAADSVCKYGTINFTATGINPANISNYQWTWGDGQINTVNVTATAHTYTNLGTYTVKLVNTDIHNCKDSLILTDYVHVVGPVASFSASAFTGCKGATINFTDASVPDASSAIKTWRWTYGDGIIDTLAGGPFNHTFNKAGNFATNLIITDAKGCNDTAVIAMSIFITDPKAKFSADTLACIGSNVNFINASTGSNLVYAWDLGNAVTTDQTNPSTNYNADSGYTVKLVATDVNGCKDSVQQNNYIKVKTVKASFTVKDSVSSCIPFEVKFTNTSIYNVRQEWDFGDGSTSTVANPTYYYTIPGTYTVKLKTYGPGGCTDSFTHTISLYAQTPTISYTPQAGCSSMDVNLHITVPGVFTYLWDLGDGNTITTNQPDLIHTYTLAGSYLPKVILNDPTGCQIPVAGTDTIKLTQVNTDFTVDDSTVCLGTLVQFSDISTSNGIITGYQWDFGDGTTSTIKNPSHVYAAPRYYTVRLIVQTAEGCTDTLVKNNYIKISGIPNIDIIGDMSSCGPTTFSFSGLAITSDTSSLIWQWNFGNTRTSISRSPEPQHYFAAQDYIVELTVTNSDGCAQKIQKSVTVHPIPQINAGKDTTICLGQSIALHAKGTGENYEWTPFASLDCSSCMDVIATPSTSTMYKVKTITGYGCENEDSIFVKVNTPSTLTVTPIKDSICIGESVQLNASGTEVYNWSPSTGLSNAQIANPVAKPTTSTIYTVTASDKEKCFTVTKNVSISVFNYPTVTAGLSQNILFGATIPLTASYSSDVVKWEWSPSANLTCTNCPAPAATPEASTTYTIKVTNNGGCTASDKITLFVPCDANNVFIPNTFSPNGDGINDIFYPMGKGIFKIQTFKVFNRWGQTVYYRTNFAPNDARHGWNGTFNGQPAQSDVYTYVVEVICLDNSLTTFNGNISLIK